MLDGTHFFECKCSNDEHTIKFIFDKDENELYTTIFLNNWYPWWKRCWIAVKYAFGYKCKYGHWDCWILQDEDVARLKALLEQIKIRSN